MKTLRLLNRNSNNSIAIAFLDDLQAEIAYKDIKSAESNKIEIEIPHGQMTICLDEIVFFSLADTDATQEDMLEMKRKDLAFQKRLAKVGLESKEKSEVAPESR